MKIKMNYYNYSIEVMSERKKKKKTILEEYYAIKIDIECAFFFLLNSKTKYTFQTPTVNYIIYKIYKFTTFNLNMKIVIAIVTLYKL